MRKKFYYVTLAVLSVAIMSSCQKSRDIIQSSQSLEGTWAITEIRSNRAYDFNGDGRSETDIYGSYTTCQRDIVLVFDRNGYGQIRQGCSASWQNISWQLTNNNNTLNIYLPNDELTLSLSQFSNYTVRGTDPVYIDGTNFSITYTLQRR